MSNFRRAISLAVQIAIHFEGFSAEPYQCPAGVWTNGYGNTDGVSEHTPPVTREQALLDLHNNLNKKADLIYRLWPDFEFLGTTKQAAIIDAFYNLKLSSILKSRFWAAIKLGKFDAAGLELLEFDKAVINGKLQSLPGLSARRHVEWGLLLYDG